MKAEDTVMNEFEMLTCSLVSKYPFKKVKDVIRETCIHQAEISFKAGQEAERERLLREFQQAFNKEVQQCHYLCRDWCIAYKGYSPKTCPIKAKEAQ